MAVPYQSKATPPRQCLLSNRLVKAAGSKAFLLLTMCGQVATTDSCSNPEEVGPLRTDIAASSPPEACTERESSSDLPTLKVDLGSSPVASSLRSLLQHNMTSTRSSHGAAFSGSQLSPEELSLLVVRELQAEDWTSMALPTIIVVLLLAAAYVWFCHPGGKKQPGPLPVASARRMAASPSPSLPPSVRAVPTMPRPSPRPSAMGALPGRSSQMVLCPELIVPDRVECTLVMPRLTQVRANSQLSITDAKGGPVFRVDFSFTPGADGTRLVLRSPMGDVTFGSASDNRVMTRQVGSPAQAAALSIISPKEPSRQYLLEVKPGGDFQVSNSSGRLRIVAVSGGYNVLDDQDHLLAFADPPDRADAADQVARCGPLVDAGLMVMCFLGIGVILSDQGKVATRGR